MCGIQPYMPKCHRNTPRLADTPMNTVPKWQKGLTRKSQKMSKTFVAHDLFILYQTNVKIRNNINKYI